MINVNVTKSINVPAHAAWEKISAFEGIEHFSPIVSSFVEGKGIGSKRTCYLPDNAKIIEALNKLDNENMHLEYGILSGPFPLTDYISDVKVKSLDDNNCEVSWSSKFNTEAKSEMKSLFEGFYHAIMEGLESLINNEAKFTPHNAI